MTSKKESADNFDQGYDSDDSVVFLTKDEYQCLSSSKEKLQKRKRKIEKDKANKKHQAEYSNELNNLAQDLVWELMLSETESEESFSLKNRTNQKRKKNIAFTTDEHFDSQQKNGTWVQCCEPHCKKWRYLDHIKEPLDVPHKWICRMNPSKNYNTCEIPEEDYSGLEFISSKFIAGSIVWAKVRGYPWWPAMVEDDPDIGIFYETNGSSSNPTHYHVVFLDDDVTRAWIQTRFVLPLCEDREYITKYIKDKKCQQAAERAYKKALYALTLPINERLKQFSFESTYKVNWLTKERENGVEEESQYGVQNVSHYGEESKNELHTYDSVERDKSKMESKHVKQSDFDSELIQVNAVPIFKNPCDTENENTEENLKIAKTEEFNRDNILLDENETTDGIKMDILSAEIITPNDQSEGDQTNSPSRSTPLSESEDSFENLIPKELGVIYENPTNDMPYLDNQTEISNNKCANHESIGCFKTAFKKVKCPVQNIQDGNESDDSAIAIQNEIQKSRKNKRKRASAYIKSEQHQKSKKIKIKIEAPQSEMPTKKAKMISVPKRHQSPFSSYHLIFPKTENTSPI